MLRNSSFLLGLRIDTSRPRIPTITPLMERGMSVLERLERQPVHALLDSLTKAMTPSLQSA